jgi:hypothetical protein
MASRFDSAKQFVKENPKTLLGVATAVTVVVLALVVFFSLRRADPQAIKDGKDLEKQSTYVRDARRSTTGLLVIALGALAVAAYQYFKMTKGASAAASVQYYYF